MCVEILRFTPYRGGRGNAVGFFDVAVREDGHVHVFKDVKLYRDGTGLRVSPKQVPTECGWTYAYLIPAHFKEKIRQALVTRWQAEQIGQLILI